MAERECPPGLQCKNINNITGIGCESAAKTKHEQWFDPGLPRPLVLIGPNKAHDQTTQCIHQQGAQGIDQRVNPLAQANPHNSTKRPADSNEKPIVQGLRSSIISMPSGI